MNDPYQFPGSESSLIERPKPSRGSWFLFVAAAAALVLSVGSAFWFEKETISIPMASSGDIEALVIKTALHRPSTETQPDGGVLGPWWIHATGTEGGTGQLLDLCLEGSDVHIAARRGRVQVDSDSDTLSLHLEQAVVVTLPTTEVDGKVDRHETLLLGPIPMSIDIEEDGNTDHSG